MISDLKQAADQVAKLVGEMKARGEAHVKVTLVAYATDHDFSKHPPSCRVTVTVTDPNNANAVVDTVVADIPTTSTPYAHLFRIPVQTVVSRLKVWKKPRRLDVSILAVPINGFEEMYDPDATNSQIHIKPATEEPRNVSLKPKGTKFNP